VARRCAPAALQQGGKVRGDCDRLVQQNLEPTKAQELAAARCSREALTSSGQGAHCAEEGEAAAREGGGTNDSVKARIWP
jgi:hypothetical protein